MADVEQGLEAILAEAQRVDRFGFTSTELERGEARTPFAVTNGC
jgi:hypothetical protein